jgi:hypothetical protein
LKKQFKLQPAEASEEGQGPRRAVKPMMMMMAMNFADEVSLSHTAEFLTYRRIIRLEADGFSSPPKEVMLRIFIALKNPHSSAAFELVNLGSNGKHDNH